MRDFHRHLCGFARTVVPASILLVMAGISFFLMYLHQEGSQPIRSTSARASAGWRGPVRKVVSIVETAYPDSHTAAKRRMRTTIVYDKQGHMLSTTWDTTGGPLQGDGPDRRDTTVVPRMGANLFHDEGNTISQPNAFRANLLRMHMWFDIWNPGHYQRTFYDQRGGLAERFVHNDDPSGGARQWTRFDGDGHFGGSCLERFSERGAVVEKILHNPDSTLAYHWQFRYNEHGQPVEKRSLNANGSLKYRLVYRYEYDKWGNWTEKTVSGWSAELEDEIAGAVFIPIETVRREITYE